MANWIEQALELLTHSLEIKSELINLDWKLDFSDKGSKFAMHLSAMANIDDGGYIVFGIHDSGEIVGVEPTDMKGIVEKVAQVAKNGLQPSVRFDYVTKVYKGKLLLFIRVFQQSDRPVSVSGKLEDSYTRSGPTTVRMDRAELRRVFSNSSDMSFEEQLLPEKYQGKFLPNILDFEFYRLKMLDESVTDLNTILHDMDQNGLIRLDASGVSVTNLGAITIAKNLKSIPALKLKTPRLIVYQNTQKESSTYDKEGGMGYAPGLIALVNHVASITRGPELIRGVESTYDVKYPIVILREVIANAIIHQDFSIEGSRVMIEIFEDRMEVTNPGSPLLETDKFINGLPRSRNDQLANLMRRFKLCEERGSGIDRTIIEIEANQLPPPKFESYDDHTRVTLYPFKPMSDYDQEEIIRACYQHACINQVSGRRTTNETIRERFNLSARDTTMASRFLSMTEQSGKIKKFNPNSSRKFTEYVPYWYSESNLDRGVTE